MMKKILLLMFIIFCYGIAQKSDNETIRTTYVIKPIVNNGSINAYALTIDVCDKNQSFDKDSFYFYRGEKIYNFGDDKKWFSNKEYKKNQINCDVRMQFSIGKVNVVKKELKDNGEIEVMGVKKRLFIYKITAEVPAWYIIRNKEGNVFYAYDLSGTYTYDWTGDRKGVSSIYFDKDNLEKKYSSEQGQILNVSYAISAVLVRAIELVQQSLYYKAEEIKASVACGKGDGDYTKLKTAQTLAIEGYKLYDKLQDGSAKLKEAITIWNEELKNYEPENKDARINRRIAIDLYKNLAYAYIFTNNISEAKKALLEAQNIQKKLFADDIPLKKIEELIILAEINNQRSAPEFSGDRKKVDRIIEESAKLAEKYPSDYFWNSQSCDLFFNKAKEWVENSRKKESSDLINISNSNNSSSNIDNSSNPFASKMVKTATQGYVLTLTFGNYPILPIEVCQLTELNELQANMAKIQTVPPEIGNLINLKHLNLANNPLKSLPPEISKLTKLETLNLKRTDIKEEDVKKIQELLPNCKIKY